MRDLVTSFVAAVYGLVDWLKHPRWWPATLWRWGRVLWVCRIPVVSSLGGGLLLSATPQARDCFSDLGLSFWQWTTFFVLMFLWAWTVHIAARRAVLADDWVPEARCGGLSEQRRKELREEYEWPALLVPRLLGLMVFLFVWFALFRARANLVTAEDVLVEAHEAVTLSWWLEVATIVTALIYILMIWTRRHVRSVLACESDQML